MASGLNGTRILVDAGDYVVRVGSGPMSQMVSVPVTVQAGETTVAPVRWGGLRVEVVDENNLPHRGAYELIRVADRQPLTVGFGADTLQGERLLTLLMPPGLYRIVPPGSNYRARTDFATVAVPEGGLVHFRLVIDPDSGRFRGAGVVSPEEVGVAPDAAPWNRRYTIGLSAPLESTRNVVGKSNETSVGADLFFDTYITYQRDRNLFSMVAGAGVRRREDRPRGLSRDPVAEDARSAPNRRPVLPVPRIAHRALRSPGPAHQPVPYAYPGDRGHAGRPALHRRAPRAGAGAGQPHVPDRRSVQPAGVSRGRRTEHAPGAAPGAPRRLAFRRRSPPEPVRGSLLPRRRRGDARGGVRPGEQLQPAGVGDDARRHPPATRFLLYNTNLDLFGSFGAAEPTIDWRSTLSWRLTAELSLDYKVDLLRLPEVSESNQVSQSVLFRYSIGS